MARPSSAVISPGIRGARWSSSTAASSVQPGFIGKGLFEFLPDHLGLLLEARGLEVRDGAALYRRRLSLLQGVHELVGQQPAAGGRGRLILACGKGDVAADGKGAGRELGRGLVGLRTVVDSDGAEVGSQAWLEEGALGSRQRPASALEELLEGLVAQSAWSTLCKL